MSIEDNLFLVHRTNIRPVPDMKIGGVGIDLTTGIQTPSKKFTRITLHWSFMDVQPNVGYMEEGKAHHVTTKAWAGHKEAKYIMIESVAAVKHLIVGGWIEDLYMIGPHTPSNTSLLIAPVSEKSEIESQGFAGQIMTYDPEHETSEEVLMRFNKCSMENLQLHVVFDLTSNLERLERQFGREMINIVRESQDVKGVFTLEDKDETEIPFRLQKVRFGYIFTTNRVGLDLCATLSVNSSVSHPSEPGELFVEFAGGMFGFTSYYFAAPWMHASHDISPFWHLELALNEGNWAAIQNILSAIQVALQPSSVSSGRFLDASAKIERLYPSTLANKIAERRRALTEVNLHHTSRLFFFNLRDHVIKNRHQTPELQMLYDINFGLVSRL